MNRTLPVARRHPIAATFGLPDFLPSFAVLWQRRELLWSMTGRNIRSQYKQSILGYAWIFVNPLMQMLVLTFVFSTILRIGSDVIPYPFPLFLFVALLPWMFFSNALSSATDSISGSASLVTKVYFPREILVTAAVFSKIVDLLFGLLILLGLMVFYNEYPSWTAVWVPAIFAIQLLFTIGLALPLAALNLFFHDVRYLVGVVLLVWFYITPVIYPVEMVPDRYKILFDLNPLSLVLNAYRRVLLDGTSPGWDRMLLGIAGALLAFLLGYYLFKRMEAGFADRI
jgi:ABC-type polysaccharide/polyol phosphate export permease